MLDDPFSDMRSVVSELNLPMEQLFDFCRDNPDSEVVLIYRRLDLCVMKLLHVYSKYILGEK